MNAVKCPNCGNLNTTEENYCLNCGTSILNLQPPSYAPIAPQQNQAFKSYGFNVPSNFNAAQYETENAFGRKVFIWYKVFCGAASLMSLFPILLGIIAIANNHNQPTPKEQTDAINGGILFIVLGVCFLFPYSLGLLLPKSSKHWILGLILLVLSLVPVGFTSCIFIPAAIVLLIFWFKPETKAYFGRK
jgi:hypothetical protein